MNRTLSLDEQNKVTVMLMQALWGAISPNFRMVAISLDAPVWHLLFVLEREVEVDRDEATEVAEEFGCLLLDLGPGSPKFDVEIRVSPGPLPDIDHAHWRQVFRRRES